MLQYNSTSGAPLGALVPCNPKLGRKYDKNAPFDPRGLLAVGTSVYVADLSNFTGQPGKVSRFDIQTGAFLGNLDITGFQGDFYPRGLDVGPNGRLYVSVVGNLANGDRLTGYVLRFDLNTGKFVDVFTSNQAAGCAAGLHRPEGLSFGPDGKLYVTAFQANANDTDKVLIFDAAGRYVNHIDLDQGGVDANNSPLPRAYGQALLFGPSGFLYVPIQGNGPDTGAVRRYNVTQSNFPYSNLVVPNAKGGPLVAPWYLTFGRTNPSTLAYGG